MIGYDQDSWHEPQLVVIPSDLGAGLKPLSTSERAALTALPQTAASLIAQRESPLQIEGYDGDDSGDDESK